jgi:RHS repeat-associated protein
VAERVRTGPTSTPFRFVGTLGYYQPTGGIAYVRARYLATSHARWMSEDADRDNSNRYQYAGDSPVRYVDPSGNVHIEGYTADQKREIMKHLRDICSNRLHLVSGGETLRKCLGRRCSDMVINCSSDKDPRCKDYGCGFGKGGPPHTTINLCPSAFTDKQGCGCLGKAIVHEMVHSCLKDEGEAPSKQCMFDLYGPGKPPCPE